MYSGVCRLAQLMKGSGPTSNGSFSVQQLITVADKVHVMEPNVNLSSAMVNDYILTHTLNTGEDAMADILTDTELGSELVHFYVLQTPGINITTGVPSTYSMIGEASIAAAVMPNIRNLLLYRVFDATWHGKQRKELDFPYQGPVGNITPPTNYQEVKVFEEALEHRPSLMEQGITYDTHISPIVQMNSSIKREPTWLDTIRFYNRQDAAVRAALHRFFAEYGDTFFDVVEEEHKHYEGGTCKFINPATISAAMSGLQLLWSGAKHAPALLERAADTVKAYQKAKEKGKGTLKALSKAATVMSTGKRDDKSSVGKMSKKDKKEFDRLTSIIKNKSLPGEERNAANSLKLALMHKYKM